MISNCPYSSKWESATSRMSSAHAGHHNRMDLCKSQALIIRVDKSWLRCSLYWLVEGILHCLTPWFRLDFWELILTLTSIFFKRYEDNGQVTYWRKRGGADAWKTYSPGETLVVRGCVEYLFPGRDWTSTRMRGRPIPRERFIYCRVVIIVMLYIVICIGLVLMPPLRRYSPHVYRLTVII